jgi:hypothetical protein
MKWEVLDFEGEHHASRSRGDDVEEVHSVFEYWADRFRWDP